MVDGVNFQIIFVSEEEFLAIDFVPFAIAPEGIEFHNNFLGVITEVFEGFGNEHKCSL